MLNDSLILSKLPIATDVATGDYGRCLRPLFNITDQFKVNKCTSDSNVSKNGKNPLRHLGVIFNKQELDGEPCFLTQEKTFPRSNGSRRQAQAS